MIKSFEYFVVIWFCYFDIYLDTLKILRTHPLRQTKKRKRKTKKKRERGRGREEIIGCTPLSLILLVYLLLFWTPVGLLLVSTTAELYLPHTYKHIHSILVSSEFILLFYFCCQIAKITKSAKNLQSHNCHNIMHYYSKTKSHFSFFF